MRLNKQTTIKLKNSKYRLFCKDNRFAVFAKLTTHRDNSSSIDFNKTVTFSSLPEFRHFITEKLVK